MNSVEVQFNVDRPERDALYTRPPARLPLASRGFRGKYGSREGGSEQDCE